MRGEPGGARTKEPRARGAGAKGLGPERDQAACGRAASPPRPAPQSLLSSRSGGPRDIREGAQLAVPAGPSRPVPSHPPSAAAAPTRGAHKARRAESAHLPPGGASGGAGALRRARLKAPAVPREHCACSAVGRGGTEDSGRAPHAAGWRYGGRPRASGAALVRVLGAAVSGPAPRVCAGP